MIGKEPLNIQRMWDEYECPGLSGVYYGDGHCLLLTVDAPERPFRDTYVVKVDAGGTLPEIEAATNFFTSAISVGAESDDASKGVKVVAGDGSREFEGFVAALNLADEKLRWLAFFSNSSPFISVSLEGDTVVGIADNHYIWRIPLHKPESVVVEPPKESSL